MSVAELTAVETPPVAPPRTRNWTMVLGVGLTALVLFTIPVLVNPMFYYIGDNPESFVPLWHHLGEQLRAGRWPVMDPAAWYGGNYAAEGEYSLWNPVQVANYVLVSFFDDLALACAVVTIEFMALLAMAATLLCRVYGAARTPAAVLGLAVPACGFCVFYAAAGWPLELIALTWVAWFWWAVQRFARGTGSPLLPAVLGVLAATTGNPYALLAMLIVLVGVGVELVVRRRFRVLLEVAVIGACAAATAAVAFLPLLNVMAVTTRQELAMIANDRFLVPNAGDLLAMSAPTYLPAIVNWDSAVRESVPSTYFAWFVVPFLPWLRWHTVRRSWQGLLSVFVVGGLFLALVLGPSNLWFFRWPVRLVEHLYLGVAVVFAVLLSAGLATDRIRARAAGSAVLVMAGAYLSATATPEYYAIHALATVAVLALVAAALFVHHRHGTRAFGVVLVTGIAVMLCYQAVRLPVIDRAAVVEPPRSVSAVQHGTGDMPDGAVLQLAEQGPVRSRDYADGKLMFGNENIMRGRETVNRYSAIEHAAFNAALCMDYKGAVCRDAYPALWRKVAGTDVPLVDAMRVRTLILQRSLLPDVTDQPPPPGWQVAEQDDVRVVWVAQAALPPGRISWTSPGMTVRSADAQAEDETVEYDAGSQGTVLFARLNWPGHSATVDGAPVPVRETTAGLIAVDVPSGRHVLRLEFHEPGLRAGTLIAGAAGAVVVVHTGLWWWLRRRNRFR
jgi:Bacterial membrane protein YfhO